MSNNFLRSRHAAICTNNLVLSIIWKQVSNNNIYTMLAVTPFNKGIIIMQ